MEAILMQKAIDERAEQILHVLNGFLQHQGVQQAVGKNIGRTQLMQLLTASKQAVTIEEVKLWVKYKAAKDKSKWGSICGNQSVADLLVASLEQLEPLAREIGEAYQETDLRRIRLGLMEKLFGYLYWQGTVIQKP